MLMSKQETWIRGPQDCVFTTKAGWTTSARNTGFISDVLLLPGTLGLTVEDDWFSACLVSRWVRLYTATVSFLPVRKTSQGVSLSNTGRLSVSPWIFPLEGCATPLSPWLNFVLTAVCALSNPLSIFSVLFGTASPDALTSDLTLSLGEAFIEQVARTLTLSANKVCRSWIYQPKYKHKYEVYPFQGNFEKILFYISSTLQVIESSIRARLTLDSAKISYNATLKTNLHHCSWKVTFLYQYLAKYLLNIMIFVEGPNVGK